MKHMQKYLLIVATLVLLLIPWVRSGSTIKTAKENVMNNTSKPMNGYSRNVSNTMEDMANWSNANKKIAASLLDMYHDTKNAEHNFLIHFENATQMFNEIKKEHKETSTSTSASVSNSASASDVIPPSKSNSKQETDSSPVSNLSSRFVQLKVKGPVEEETIWRALYDTQLRRSPASATVNVFSEENIMKEFEEAQMDAYVSEIIRMKTQFKKNLFSMSEELTRQKKIRETVKKVLLLEEEIKKLEKINQNQNQNGPIRIQTNRKEESTKVLC